MGIVVGLIVAVLVLGMGGLAAFRTWATVEVARDAHAKLAADPEMTARSKRGVTLMLTMLVGFWAVLAGLFYGGREASGPELGGALAIGWVLLALVGGIIFAIWWDKRHDNL